jgi:hypothetical protein
MRLRDGLEREEAGCIGDGDKDKDGVMADNVDRSVRRSRNCAMDVRV